MKPSKMRTIAQMPAPMLVYMENLIIFILDKPAGIEISCRMPGISLPVKVEIAPCL